MRHSSMKSTFALWQSTKGFAVTTLFRLLKPWEWDPINAPLCCRDPASGHGAGEGCCMVLDWPGKDAQGELLHNLKV